MESDPDRIEVLLRKTKPREPSPEMAARIAGALGTTCRAEAPARRRSLLRYWPAAAAAAAVAVLLSICSVPQTDRSVPAKYVPLLSHVALMPREDLGHFVTAAGAPVEAFRYQFTEKSVWRRADGKKTIETAVPFEAVVWVETPVY